MKLNLKKGQRLWFTSDTHYNHANICSATTQWVNPVTLRDFKSLEHMNAYLVGNINELVGQDDILFHLGDWSFGGFESIQKFRDQIVCKNIHLILGDGMLGFEQGAPYAGIISAAGGENIPPAWLEQLAVGGRLVAPVANAQGSQVLVVIDKMENSYKRSFLEPVHFVPLRSGVA